MPRVPYVSDEAAQPHELVEAIRSRRGGQLLNLDRVLLHSPTLAAGWNAYLGAVRNCPSIAPRLRELAICAVAVINGADYEFEQHIGLFEAHGGHRSSAAALVQFDTASNNPTLFDSTERVVLQLVGEMTRQVQVSDATFNAAKVALGSDQAMVEMVAIIACYNMVSRLLVALQVHIQGEMPSESANVR